jgi:hypothetical protein
MSVQTKGVRVPWSLFNSEGIRPSPTKVQAIVNLPTPTQDTLKSVLGRINYLGQYVPGFQNIIKPINDLLKSDVEFMWGSAQENA